MKNENKTNWPRWCEWLFNALIFLGLFIIGCGWVALIAAAILGAKQ